VAHRIVGAAGCAKITYGGDARLDGLARVGRGKFDGLCRLAPRLLQRRRPRRAVPVVRHVRVRIDEAGDRGEGPEVDHLGASRYRAVAGADALDAVALDDDDGVVDGGTG